MFLNFQRINNGDPTKLSDITVNLQDIISIGVDRLENKRLQTSFAATRVEVNAFPLYSFHTTSAPDSFANLASVFVVDVPYSVDQDYVCGASWYPFIRVPQLVNNTRTATTDLIINPQHLVFAEETIYNDVKLGQQTCLLVVLRDSQPKRLLLDMTLNDLKAIIEPDEVPL